MRAFLFGGVLAAVIFLAWTNWFAEDPVKAGGSGQDQNVQPAGHPSLDARGDQDAGAQPSPKADDRELLAGMQRGNAAAADAVFSRLSGLEATDPRAAERLGDAVREAVAGVGSDPIKLLASLGSSNAYLHTAAGRALGGSVLETSDKLADGPRAALLTELIERSMRGPLENDDAEALAFFDRARRELEKVAFRYVCDPTNIAKARTYEIRKGDSLDKVVKHFTKQGVKLSTDALALFNRISNKNIVRQGQRIKVPTEPLHAVLEKQSFMMALYLGETIFRVYRVGHGADGKTPVATFSVGDKLEKPDWWSPTDGKQYPYGHPKNILGGYWVKLDHPSFSGFGAHGTPKPETIGTESSLGCIRMRDADIAEFFGIASPGMEVDVRDHR